MGLWAASRAQASAVAIGTDFLDGIVRSGTRIEPVFTSPYHIAFLFRLLLYLTAGQLRKAPDDGSIQEGVAVAMDRLQKKYFGAVDELCMEARNAAFSDDPEARKACEDVDLLLSASFGDDESLRKVEGLVQAHPVWGDETTRQDMAAIGLDLGQTTSLAISILFIDTVPPP